MSGILVLLGDRLKHRRLPCTLGTGKQHEAMIEITRLADRLHQIGLPEPPSSLRREGRTLRRCLCSLPWLAERIRRLTRPVGSC